MPTGTFVIFDIIRFPDEPRTMKTEPRPPRGSRDEAADPVYTQIKFPRDSRVGPFRMATVTHRKPVRVEGYWHGNLVMEVIQHKQFHAYFDVDEKALISHVQKDIALAAVDALNREFKEVFFLRELSLDFARIIPQALNVIGSWFKGMRFTNVRTEAAFGSQINRDPEFQRLSGLGSHSNLIVVMNFASQTIKVNLSRDGSAFFMDDTPLSVCLDFMLHLRHYRLESPPASNQ